MHQFAPGARRARELDGAKSLFEKIDICRCALDVQVEAQRLETRRNRIDGGRHADRIPGANTGGIILSRQDGVELDQALTLETGKESSFCMSRAANWEGIAAFFVSDFTRQSIEP